MPKSHVSHSFQAASLLPLAQKAEPSLLALLRQMVEIESPSHDFAAVNRCVEAVAEMGTGLGAKARRHKSKTSGDVLELRFASRKKGRPLLLLGHLDTVWAMGTLAKMPYRHIQKDGEERICGPGVLDMKGGVAMALTALDILQQQELLKRTVTLLLVGDETGLFEDFEMLGNSRPADRQVGSQGADRARARGESFEDLAAGRIGQGRYDGRKGAHLLP